MSDVAVTMTKPVIFVINGPQRVGKDTAAEAMAAWGAGAGHAWKLAPLTYHVKVSTLQVHGLSPDMLDIYEQVKDEPMPAFGALRTFRQAIIQHSHEMKETYGADVWIKRWQDEVKLYFELGMASAVILSDCRFEGELLAALAITRAVLLYRVYRNLKLHHDADAWNGDVGSWLFPELFDVQQVALINDGHIDDLRYLAGNTAYHFFRRTQRAAASV